MGQGQPWLKISQASFVLHLSLFPIVAVNLLVSAPVLSLPAGDDTRFSTVAPLPCPTECSCTVDETLPPTAFCDNKNLRSVPAPLPSSLVTLDLANNDIDHLHEALTSLHSLQRLSLHNNSITVLTLGMFDGLFQLQVLDLSHNDISTIEPHAFASLPFIKTLDLSHNQLTALDNQQLFGLESVAVLNVSGNKIRDLSNATFLNFTYLQTLDISYNKLQALQGGIFQDLINVKHVNLSYNHLLFIDEVIVGLHNLQTLDLSYNMLELGESVVFADVPSLRTLDLSFNNISETSQFLKNVTSLQSLSVRGNPISHLDGPVFQDNKELQLLDISQMSHLAFLSFDAFDGAYGLVFLNLSHNPHLSFLHPELFSLLPKLSTLDLRNDNISILSQITFHNNPELLHLYLSHNPFDCGCGLAWLWKLAGRNGSALLDRHNVKCTNAFHEAEVPIALLSEDMVQCSNITLVNVTDTMVAKIGSQLVLRCDYKTDKTGVLTWTTPRGLVFHYHPFHPEATAHLILSQETANVSHSFHQDHAWHTSTGYWSDLDSMSDHVVLQSDGSLLVDYILRNDAGPYECTVHNAHHRASAIITVRLDYTVLFEVKIMSILVGMGCAASFLTLNTVYVVIMWTARRLVNKRRREAISSLLESLEEYRTSQISRIRTNYSHQVGKIRDQYHCQSVRLREHYSTQMKRVRRGCSNQVERIRDNYHAHMGHLKDYSSHQIHQIREATNHQMVRIRDYGMLQVERLREKYKWQQKHVIKMLEALNMDNCRNIVDTECVRTDSMMYDINFATDLEEDGSNEEVPSSRSSPSASDYVTAISSSVSSQESLATVTAEKVITEVLVACPSTYDSNVACLHVLPCEDQHYDGDSEVEEDSTDTGTNDDDIDDVRETVL
ncbi:leucine-rich repeat neuronal protein 1-like [Pomacea canaliculata]|uniref:leucine-rich repeat neuronal protein 1-like n=1 Tax=Pomacea canaliculata TaxID=400727 RepID=UPI000D73ED52|nr:leucine-rich repeat neuronal protein 1-like [Pomacea canaliculata]XP_025085644.1 leucine-rich repeat neuronal protein 1-like [Pomacea canaliculata]XP_025085646.1 leucine-rich repeat neuronal protein 1-like [Pomacea canaliculata]XP_025085647.1 leucine-rich repeat neuronal protein 1-like [Pomacea canaliculata]XP_025085648.1 leucine-rich repeat neuronal protein 1-like [Pomacea canaliculata]XP_025085649.1 leucine-rich repeat neuronal protein 1-like [Pomacea canaliculata]XP_025085650.1 leucine-